jgi:hypothetical protein
MEHITRERRRPRFSRTRLPGALRLTDRDLTILRHVHEHRILNSGHITELLSEHSRVETLRRLQRLYHHGFLDRPRAQLGDLYLVRGSSPIAYALDSKGAQVLSEKAGISVSELGWKAKNRELTHLFYEHTLFVSSVMVALERACRERGNARIVPFSEILATKSPDATRRLPRPQTWSVKVSAAESGDVDRPQTLGITPDKIFGIQLSDLPEGRNTAYFFLEADRAEMPVIRRRLSNATSIFKKLVTYHATSRQALHQSRFGMPNFRVLMVTTSPARVETMRGAFDRLKGATPNVFLFADLPSLVAGDAFSLWTNGRGVHTPLFK